MSVESLWNIFQQVHLQIPIPDAPTQPLQFDNPFLVNYMVYHHYRALGWVVRGGLKFCVDYLLYKRGPVFAHAEYVWLYLTRMTIPQYCTQICLGNLSGIRGSSRPRNIMYKSSKRKTVLLDLA